jgi:Cytochrome c7 and related cytochrome c/Class III cytochrome C family
MQSTRRAGLRKACATFAAAARTFRRGARLRLLSASRAAVVLAFTAASCGAPPAQVSSTFFTPAHRTMAEAARDYFGIRPKPEQPIPFPHKTHIDKKAECVDCHESVAKGPIAGIPSVKTCMICHSQIATDRPLIKQVTGYSDKGIEIPWQRVYGFTREAHVRFNHAPHVRASVECSACHGDVAKQSVAERVVDHNMGFCVNCHKQKNAPNECLTCHY